MMSNTAKPAVKLKVPADVTRQTLIWETTLPANHQTYPLRVSAKSQVFDLTTPIFETVEDNRNNGNPVGWLYVNATDDQAILVKVQ